MPEPFATTDPDRYAAHLRRIHAGTLDLLALAVAEGDDLPAAHLREAAQALERAMERLGVSWK